MKYVAVSLPPTYLKIRNPCKALSVRLVPRKDEHEFFAWRRTNPVDETDDSPMIIPFSFSKLARSSSRLGHGPLKAEIRVRSPYALPTRFS
jgi:hypothetical protein